jgi:putative ABC transport system permease protein
MYWIKRLFRKERVEAQLDSELRFHLDQRTAELVASGMTVAEARRHARVEFGGVEGVKEECRESRRVHIIETLLQDIRYGLRMMRRNPGFTTVAILTLALGIGANTAIFSVVNGVLLNPLPYPHPEQLVGLHQSKANFQTGSVSFPNFLDWQKDNRSFSAMAIMRGYSFSLTGAGEADQVNGLFISSEFFDLLGVKPVIGRTLRAGEDAIGAAPVVLIAAGLWQRKFGASPGVLGQAITLEGKRFTIIGVVPASIQLPVQHSRIGDVYVPIGQWNNPSLAQRSAPLGIHGVGRLKPGVTVEQARADMARVTGNLAAAYPEVNKGNGATLIPLRAQIVGNVQPFLLVLLAAVGFVLLIACVNVANLLLARSTARTREFAVRVALGASRFRIMRQLLTESILLAAAGGLLGFALAAWGENALVRNLPPELPRAAQIRLDDHVLIFAALAALVAGIAFGLAPALKTSRPDVVARAKEGSQSLSRARHRTQSAFVVVEIATALVLLVGAGLMIRCLTRLAHVDPGFDSHNILTFSVSFPPSMSKESPGAVHPAFRELENTIASVAGVRAVSLSSGALPLSGDDEALFWMEGQPKPASANEMNWAVSYVVSPDYLKVMRTPLLRGRFFDSHDDEHSAPVAVVDESFVTKFFPTQDPIGKRFNLLNGRSDGDPPVEIIGVVKHVKQWSLDKDEQLLQAQMYRPFMQLKDSEMSFSGTDMAVRTGDEPMAVFNSIRGGLRRMSVEYVAYDAESMEQIISRSVATQRYSMILLGGFAALALLLASVGIYGVISYVVGQRTQEIGIRMALGAQRLDVLRLVIGHGARMVLFGVLAGVAAALALTQLMSTVLFGVSPTDPLTFAGVAVLLAIVALLACYVPARRAARVNPITALRCE